MKLSIIIPVYNEMNTIQEILKKIEDLHEIKKQIIIIDDGSSDETFNLIQNYKFKSEHKIIKHKVNSGKGAAIKSSVNYILGDIVIIQDADLEYDPKDYKEVIFPIIKNKSKIVYGSRVLNKKRYNQTNFISNFRIFCNHILTLLTNLLYRQNLTDAHTCYKAFDANIFKQINLKENDFAFCPEITAKVSKLGFKIFEVPINYVGRNYNEGKKISFYDGIRAVIVLLKYRFFN
ncbi:glycosyltransferase family 2 protein [Candidatus Pelagibacter sp.]|uniref:glycosyltransferase family 2 protein n=1 Tax=Candidatus Pelagibacter sp. TaxID=2024849 RepID=UPI003F859057